MKWVNKYTFDTSLQIMRIEDRLLLAASKILIKDHSLWTSQDAVK